MAGEETAVDPAGKSDEHSYEEIDAADENRERPDVKPPKIERENDGGAILRVLMKPSTGHNHAAAEKKPAPKRESNDPKRAFAQRSEKPRLAPMQHAHGDQRPQDDCPQDNVNKDILHQDHRLYFMPTLSVTKVSNAART